MNKKTVIKISDRELDTLVADKLGYKNYNFVPVEECGNDSSHQFDVTGEIDEFDQEDIDSWAAGEFVHYSNGTVLNKLCAEGYIAAAEYIVTVCW